MSEQVLTRNDRIAGIALLALSAVLLFMPSVEIAGQRVRLSTVGTAWFLAAIMLLMAGHASRPNPRLTRWAAAFLLAFGFAAPFVAQLIDRLIGVAR